MIFHATDRRNPQSKKHKTWDGDAVLVANNSKATLFDIDGKTYALDGTSDLTLPSRFVSLQKDLVLER